MNKQEFRASVLEFYGASDGETEELLAYNYNVFDRSWITNCVKFPLAPEPHVITWESYAIAARIVGAFSALKQRLVQLRFPILEGISQTPAYRAATLKGIPVDGMAQATGLVLQQPEKLVLMIHNSCAGAIPVLLTENREDFVSLVQALTMRNEPLPIPASMGACMVAGFNNWDRIRQYRQQWSAQNPAKCSESSWKEEFGRLIPQKELYQDQPEWQRLSLIIRLEHECTHYFTRRLFNSMRNNLLDELIADYRGIVAATGRYRADWFLRFLGLESFPNYREGDRLQNYQGQPPLSARAFKILQALVKAAAENLECFDVNHANELSTPNGQTLMLVALTYLTLEELASGEANSRIHQTLEELQLTLCA